MHKIAQWGGFQGRPLEPLLKTGLPLKRNALKLFAKSALIKLWLVATASAKDTAIHKECL